jgi:hypothetical protein
VAIAQTSEKNLTQRKGDAWRQVAKQRTRVRVQMCTPRLCPASLVFATTCGVISSSPLTPHPGRGSHFSCPPSYPFASFGVHVLSACTGNVTLHVLVDRWWHP